MLQFVLRVIQTKGDRPPRRTGPYPEMLFPCLSGLSAYRNPQGLLALDALLLETTELHRSCRFLVRKIRRKSFSAKKKF
ncbi:MAG: hypothetical protein IJ156_04625 [Bacteroidales bacterium]|nr:hypothetical protein [Bacteroidales bacterium]